MSARPPPKFYKKVGRNTVNIPFNFYTNSGAKMTLNQLNDPMVQPYDTDGLEVIITKMRPNAYEVRNVEDQNELDAANLNAKLIKNVSDPNLLAGPRKLQFRLPPGMGNARKSRKQRKANRKTRRLNRSNRR